MKSTRHASKDPFNARRWFTLLGLPGLVWVVIFMGLPFLFVIVMSLGWDLGTKFNVAALGWHELARALQMPYRGVFISSIMLAGGATVLCLFISFPICLLLWRLGPQRSRKWLIMIMAPFLLNFLVRVYAWFIMLRPEGLLGTLARVMGYQHSLISSMQGILLGLVYGYLPFMILPLWAVMEKLDLRQWEAARDLGAPFRVILWRIVLPHSFPGIAAGSILVFVPMLGEYTIPKMLGGGLVPTLGTTIESQFFSGVSPHWSFGAALALLLILMVAAMLMVMRRGLRLSFEQSRGQF